MSWVRVKLYIFNSPYHDTRGTQPLTNCHPIQIPSTLTCYKPEESSKPIILLTHLEFTVDFTKCDA